jgi:hypothetical protein
VIILLHGAKSWQLYVDNIRVVNNVLKNVSMVVRGNSGIEIRNNLICNGTIPNEGVTQSGNRFTCDNLPPLDLAPLADKLADTIGDAIATLPTPKLPKFPAPKNLRLVVQP